MQWHEGGQAAPRKSLGMAFTHPTKCRVLRSHGMVLLEPARRTACHHKRGRQPRSSCPKPLSGKTPRNNSGHPAATCNSPQRMSHPPACNQLHSAEQLLVFDWALFAPSWHPLACRKAQLTRIGLQIGSVPLMGACKHQASCPACSLIRSCREKRGCCTTACWPPWPPITHVGITCCLAVTPQ